MIPSPRVDSTRRGATPDRKQEGHERAPILGPRDQPSGTAPANIGSAPERHDRHAPVPRRRHSPIDRGGDPPLRDRSRARHVARRISHRSRRRLLGRGPSTKCSKRLVPSPKRGRVGPAERPGPRMIDAARSSNPPCPRSVGQPEGFLDVSRGSRRIVVNEFAARIRDLRRKRRVTLRHLARLVGVSPSYLSRVERSHVPPPGPRTITKIARALQVETDELMAAAALVPEDITARLLRRPRLMGRLVRCADGLDDARLEDLSRKLERDLSP